MRTVRCSNSKCGADIDVLPGLVMAPCPKCGSWVDLQQDASHASGSAPQSIVEPPGAMGYELPPSPSLGGSDWPVPNGPEGNLPYMAPTVGSGPGSPPDWVGLGSQPSGLSLVEEEERPPEPKGRLIFPDGHQVNLALGRNTIGRQKADIIINDPSVSRIHCVVEVTADARDSKVFHYLIWDVGHETGTPSTNGVFLSHRSLRLSNTERIPLSDGIVILLGVVRLLFELRPENP